MAKGMRRSGGDASKRPRALAAKGQGNAPSAGARGVA